MVTYIMWVWPSHACNVGAVINMGVVNNTAGIIWHHLECGCGQMEGLCNGCGQPLTKGCGHGVYSPLV